MIYRCVVEGASTYQSILGTRQYTVLDCMSALIRNDNQLNQIFETAAYTLSLCVHNSMIWDGIKRDRFVWIGDMQSCDVTSFSIKSAAEQFQTWRKKTCDKTICIPFYG